MKKKDIVRGRVIPSMSPKGVEHTCSCKGWEFKRRVIPSMSPKGVEHNGEDIESSINHAVIPSMSPKGVEHIEMFKKGKDAGS